MKYLLLLFVMTSYYPDSFSIGGDNKQWHIKADNVTVLGRFSSADKCFTEVKTLQKAVLNSDLFYTCVPDPLIQEETHTPQS